MKLSTQDLSIITQAVIAVSEYKEKTLGEGALDIYINKYLKSIIEQINNNEFRVNDRLKNTFLWLLDQLEYTGVGKQFPDALIICKIAARGQQAYDRTRRSNFNQLFSIGEAK